MVTYSSELLLCGDEDALRSQKSKESSAGIVRGLEGLEKWCLAGGVKLEVGKLLSD